LLTCGLSRFSTEPVPCQRREMQRITKCRFLSGSFRHCIIAPDAIDESLAHDGIKPQRTNWNERFFVMFCLTMTTYCVGAMFERGVHEKSSSIPK
jgi:hypothetical protein